MDAKIGALYRVERDVVYRKRASWKLKQATRSFEWETPPFDNLRV